MSEYENVCRRQVDGKCEGCIMGYSHKYVHGVCEPRGKNPPGMYADTSAEYESAARRSKVLDNIERDSR